MFITSAPGKVIIFGEHSAVYNKPAVAAAASSLRSYLLVKPMESIDDDEPVLQLNCPNLQFTFNWSMNQLLSIIDSHDLQKDTDTVQLSNSLLNIIDTQLLSEINNPLQRSAAQCFLYLYLSIVPRDKRTPLQFSLISTLPVGAGLGSSASISVALAQAFLKLNSVTLQDKSLINQWAFIGETCMHGTPSGIDNTIATFGGALQFTKGDPMGPKELHPIKPIVAVLTYTKIPRSTKVLVEGVRELYNTMPTIIEPLLDSMATVALKGSTALENGQLEEVLQLVRINHGQLVSLGVSHPGLEVIRNLTTDLKIGETKLTGAGGGGCALTFLNNSATTIDVEQFRNTLQEKFNYQTFETALGGFGCSLLELDQLTPTRKQQIIELFDVPGPKISMEQVDNILLPGGPADLPWIL
ncbi:similar to Saccharomyces cerevisiae YMR208W ERG12 Mevalonate kinase, acts in the biosynthesis of isoprenoids and sterols, including ergosterol, from mevalonate [Maudiozyma saulgeensis]|uniref:Mevalonate kinase n=1 Tax=Maudiozyma saulgeensis TaxID=1789683 RepID=A0A1X7R911_9SACH|nr:similar to Saccharomyces cerevisiae YMR208W ERG12 Mevalonate kinase, acts in the biosynthesis of isoprenoids and sterols, including ergosterol, from mevalonate [Kazachstania saulgeensis]